MLTLTIYNTQRELKLHATSQSAVTVIFYDMYPADCIMTVILLPTGIDFRNVVWIQKENGNT